MHRYYNGLAVFSAPVRAKEYSHGEPYDSIAATMSCCCIRPWHFMWGSAAGNWIFSNSQWLNERAILETNYATISQEAFLYAHLTEVTPDERMSQDHDRLQPAANSFQGFVRNRHGVRNSQRSRGVSERAPACEEKETGLQIKWRPSPKAARAESPSDSSWLGRIDDSGWHEGTAPDPAQPQRAPPGGATTPDGPPAGLPDRAAAAPAPPSPPPASAFTPCSKPRARCSSAPARPCQLRL
jgi:hypothetical protein